MNKKYSKQEILLEGLFLLRRKGYHNTGVNAILKTCGIPKGSFYNFFKSKEDFAIQVLQLYTRQMQIIMEQEFTDLSKSPLERLQSFYELLIETNADENGQNGCFLMNLTTEVSGYNNRLAAVTNEEYMAWLKRIAPLVQEGQEEGEIRDDYPAIQLAAYLHNNFFGSMVQSKMRHDIQAMALTFQLTFDFLTH